MTWNTVRETDEDGVENVYVFEDDDEDKRQLVYRLVPTERTVIFYPKDDFVVDEVTLDGFHRIPSEFSEKGYVKGGIQYYLDKKLGELPAHSFVITTDEEAVDRVRKIRNKDAYRVTLTYNSLRELAKGVRTISREAQEDRSEYADDFFQRTFPTRYSSSGRSAARRARRVIRNLDESVVEKLSRDDVEAFLDFLEVLLDTRYSQAAKRRELFGAAKIKVDEVALSEVIAEFEELLAEDPAESKWGKFLRQNLFLVESKYIRVIPELNVVLGSQRKVDFGLVDAQGYLDLFEIKKPSTKLLAANQDRGNYYWHSDAAKAIAQAEKYLYNAERKAAALAEDINRQRKVEVKVVRPRAVIIIGSTEQLADDNRAEDFRVLRQSLKNIDIVLYDELLERLRNQRSKLYVDADVELEASVDGDTQQ